MKYLSVCSGIEAASVAWEPLGWRPFGFSEIEKFPSAVLAHRFPDTPNFGDMTNFREWPDATIDVLVGGTPCQSFSVAGLRAGLDDPRGNLALVYLAIAQRYRPRFIVWENVPGVLSSNGGRDFGSILGGLVELGYGFAYRVLDAQYVRTQRFQRAVPQRRRRVFVVGYLGDWRRAAAVLFERESLCGHPAPRREAGQVAPTIPSRSSAGGGLGTDFDCDGGLIASSGPTSHCLNAGSMGHGESHANAGGQLAVAHAPVMAIQEQATKPNPKTHGLGMRDDGAAYTLEARGPQAVAFDWYASQSQSMPVGEECPPLKTTMQPAVHNGWQVRRLTPVECERLQGFPDGWTDVPYRGKRAADGPRYKALGNSMAVNVMAWIGERIAAVDALSADVVEVGRRRCLSAGEGLC